MSQIPLPQLPPFESLRENLENERKTVIQVNSFTGDDEDFVRSVEDATIILDFIEKVQRALLELFTEAPSLMTLFHNEFMSVQEFFQRNFVIDAIFLDDCLFAEKEMFLYGQDGGISPQIIGLHEKTLLNWIDSKRSDHNGTQDYLRNNFDTEKKLSEMACQCITCSADYRTRLRDAIYEECLTTIEIAKEAITSAASEGIIPMSEAFREMQRQLDKQFFRVRYRLKRSSLNRLESQVKHKVKELFQYPCAMTDLLLPHVRTLFAAELQALDFQDDLILDDEYARFYAQLGLNLWKGDRILEREFKKFVKAIVILKKKDVSSKILQEYIGEFWIHSSARSLNRKIIYHMGPTNSGKTYHAIEQLCASKTGCYLAPLRLLAAELFDTMNQKGVRTSLLTGEEVVDVEESTHFSSTIEMAKLHQPFDCVVIDEIQMINDPQRGWAWTRALVNVVAPEVHLCGDQSVLELVQKIVDLCGDTLEIRRYERMTELKVESRPIVPKELNKHDAVIVFSRRNALRFKYDLERLGFKVSIVYGRLSPEVRREQARKFDKGITDIMVSTDAIAMGMNLPIRRIVFTTLTKYINNQEYPISFSEIKQIAGRAGRFNRFPTGYVTCLDKVEEGLETVHEALNIELEQKEECMVGPDLEIYTQVNNALKTNGLPPLKLSEFLRLFNAMTFQKPFFCVELKEMIELTEMVEDADVNEVLSPSEVFGFACAPVNLGLLEHVQYYVWIVNNFVKNEAIRNEPIDAASNDIDYLETSIKCVELYQWLSRHFNGKNFDFSEEELLANKGKGIEKLNDLLSDKMIPMDSRPFNRRDGKKRFDKKGAPGQPRSGGGGGGSGGAKKFYGRKGAEGKGPGEGGANRFKKKRTRKRKFNKPS